MYPKCSSSRFDDALETLASTERKVLSMFPPWLQSFVWWLFSFSLVFPQNVKNPILKNAAIFFFSSFSLLSTIPFNEFLWGSVLQCCWPQVGDSHPVITCTAEVLAPLSIPKFSLFYLEEYLENLCLEFWFTEWALSSLELSRSRCTGVLWFKPSQELSTTSLTYSLFPAGCRENKRECKSEKNHRLR